MGLSQSTPASLLDRLHDAADQEARDRFVQFCGPLVFAFADRLGVPRERRLDFTQDVFLLVFEKIPSFVYRRDLRFRGWLFSVMRNKHRDWHRRERPAEALPEVPDKGEPPDLAKEEFERFVVHRALAIMKSDFEEKTWRACWELVVEEKSGKETAAALGMTVAAVYQARTKVLRRLREELAGILD